MNMDIAAVGFYHLCFYFSAMLLTFYQLRKGQL
jgi:hypothetical protein